MLNSTRLDSKNIFFNSLDSTRAGLCLQQVNGDHFFIFVPYNKIHVMSINTIAISNLLIYETFILSKWKLVRRDSFIVWWNFLLMVSILLKKTIIFRGNFGFTMSGIFGNRSLKSNLILLIHIIRIKVTIYVDHAADLSAINKKVI
jgi:hypothetical protein